MTGQELNDYLDAVIADGNDKGYTWPPAPIPGVPGMDPGEARALAAALEAAEEAAAARQREAEEAEASASDDIQQTNVNGVPVWVRVRLPGGTSLVWDTYFQKRINTALYLSGGIRHDENALKVRSRLTLSIGF